MSTGPLPHVRVADPAGLQATVSQRRQDVAHLQQRHAETGKHLSAWTLTQQHQRTARAELDAALEQRRLADLAAEREGEALVESWSRYGASLVQLDEPVLAGHRLMAELLQREPQPVDPAGASATASVAP